MGVTFPLGLLPHQLLPAPVGEAVVFPGAAVGLGLVGGDVTPVLQLFQHGVEGTFLHLEGVVGAALQLRDHLVPVQVLALEQGEDQQGGVFHSLLAFHGEASFQEIMGSMEEKGAV